ncbi:MAG: multicomponent Na+:H+ antiporter subunit D, partial [Verrucomicrobiales bacterium]
VIAITLVGFLNAIYSKTRVREETPRREHYFYALYLLLVAGLCGMVLTNDAFNLYVLLEICSLTSYALIAIGNRRAALASFNYVIIGTIGASFYLLGVGYLYIKTGALNMDGIHEVLKQAGIADSPTVKVGFILIMMGVWIKMALFPLHGWLSNAYSYAPTSTGALMAPLMTKVMVYIMIRMMISVFGIEFVFHEEFWSNGVVWIATIAVICGSVLALARDDIKKMLTYLIVAEVGYMVGGAWLGNRSGMLGASYHILADAAMTFCLFLAAGILINRTGKSRMDAFDGAFKKFPLTMTGFTVGALAMIGLPPTCGFFSKFYLIRGGIEAGQWQFVVALLISSLVNAVLFFRIFERAYFPKDVSSNIDHLPDQEAQPERVLGRVPYSMLIPLLIAAASLLIIGLANKTIVAWLDTAFAGLSLK